MPTANGTCTVRSFSAPQYFLKETHTWKWNFWNDSRMLSRGSLATWANSPLFSTMGTNISDLSLVLGLHTINTQVTHFSGWQGCRGEWWEWGWINTCQFVSFPPALRGRLFQYPSGNCELREKRQRWKFSSYLQRERILSCGDGYDLYGREKKTDERRWGLWSYNSLPKLESFESERRSLLIVTLGPRMWTRIVLGTQGHMVALMLGSVYWRAADDSLTFATALTLAT